MLQQRGDEVSFDDFGGLQGYEANEISKSIVIITRLQLLDFYFIYTRIKGLGDDFH